MDRKIKGRLAEAKVITYLIEAGYEIYLPFCNNSKYDVISYKDGEIKKVSIKFTSVKRQSGSWAVEMRQIFRGNGRINIHKFDKHQYDMVAVYIGPEDKVILIDASLVKARSLHVRT